MIEIPKFEDIECSACIYVNWLILREENQGRNMTLDSQIEQQIEVVEDQIFDENKN
jgi:hypothetical protein